MEENRVIKAYPPFSRFCYHHLIENSRSYRKKGGLVEVWSTASHMPPCCRQVIMEYGDGGMYPNVPVESEGKYVLISDWGQRIWSCADLVHCRNPHPMGVVMRDWLCRSRMGLAKGLYKDDPDKSQWLLMITWYYKVTRHAGPDKPAPDSDPGASRLISDSKSFWIPAFAGMTIEMSPYCPL